MITRTEPTSRSGGGNESGAALILVLVFMVVGGIIVGALLTAARNDLSNSASFSSARSLQYDAASAANLAVQSIRYTPELSPGQTLNASPPAPCWGSGAPSQYVSSDGNTISVWCSTLWAPTSATTRIVTVSACPSTVAVVACAASPLLQAVVTFDDYPPGLSAPTAVQCVVYCGTAMTIDGWVRLPVVPIVTGIGTTSGPITGGTSITISGSGFVAGSTVNFVAESGGSPGTSNLVVPAPIVTVSSSSSITVQAPSVTAATTYFVTVTTPTGTSPYGGAANDVFTSTSVVPAFTSLSPATGSTAGGTFVTITGSGFVTGSVVKFVQESGGTPASPANALSASSVTVVSNSSITAVSPSVTTGTTYFVTVSTPAGTSAYGAGSTDVFTYSPLVPTVASISPTSGPPAGGTSITITGTGFVSGATVNFVEESGGSPVTPSVSLAGTGVVISSATSITAVSPPITAGTTYFVTVTTPTGTSDYYPIFTY